MTNEEYLKLKPYYQKYWKDRRLKDKAFRRDRSDYQRNRTKNFRITLMNILGGAKCICGFSDSRALQIGHKFNDGATERNAFKNADKMYRYYIDNPKIARLKLEVTCANCNTIDMIERRLEV
jgi:hypothetical protein